MPTSGTPGDSGLEITCPEPGNRIPPNSLINVRFHELLPRVPGRYVVIKFVPDSGDPVCSAPELVNQAASIDVRLPLGPGTLQVHIVDPDTFDCDDLRDPEHEVAVTVADSGLVVVCTSIPDGPS